MAAQAYNSIIWEAEAGELPQVCRQTHQHSKLSRPRLPSRNLCKIHNKNKWINKWIQVILKEWLLECRPGFRVWNPITSMAKEFNKLTLIKICSWRFSKQKRKLSEVRECSPSKFSLIFTLEIYITNKFQCHGLLSMYVWVLVGIYICDNTPGKLCVNLLF